MYASLVDLLDQGVAGDANGDAVVDCDDLAAVLAHPFDAGISSCHPDYRIEFAWDLDADNDLDDRMNILRAIQPADFDGNCVINFFDLNIFLDEYNNQTPAGDFNGDGEWNIFDINAFLSAYNNPC